MNVREIGKAVCVPFRTVNRYLLKAGVEMRAQGAPHDPRLDDVVFMRQSYEAGMSTSEIAKALGSTASTVRRWLVRHGIETRSCGSQKGHKRNTEEAKRKMSAARVGRFRGPESPAWKGGISRSDPDRNRYPAKQWSRLVKERDGYKCRECGCADGVLHSHHIKRWMDYPELRYDVDNGITLCEPCHQKAHGKGFAFPWLRHAESSTSALPRANG